MARMVVLDRRIRIGDPTMLGKGQGLCVFTKSKGWSHPETFAETHAGKDSRDGTKRNQSANLPSKLMERPE